MGENKVGKDNLKLFYVDMGKDALERVANVPTLYGDDTFKASEVNDCVQKSLYLLELITDEDYVKQTVSCNRFGSGSHIDDIVKELEQKYPGSQFTSRTSSTKGLGSFKTLPPGSGTIVICTNVFYENFTFPVVMIKDRSNILYLVDGQNNVKYGCSNIETYMRMNYLNSDSFICFFEKTHDSIEGGEKQSNEITSSKRSSKNRFSNKRSSTKRSSKNRFSNKRSSTKRSSTKRRK